MRYQIDPNAWQSVFAVPSILVDKYLKLAGAVQLKVLLWLLRHPGQELDQQAISHSLGISPPDAADAMLYWQECGLIIKGEGAMPSTFTTRETAFPESSLPQSAKVREPESPTIPVSLVSPEKSLVPPEPAKAPRILSRPRKADNAFVAKRIQESPEIAYMMQEAQQILGRLINNGESATLLMIHDEFGLPVDVIIMLLHYAAGVNKANMRYIEKTAMNWADEEIFTHQKAEEKLRRLDEEAKAWRVVESVLGTGHRAPTQSETEMASQWVRSWKFSREMIREAYERCVNQTGKINLRYMHKILERWNREGISTLSEALQEQARKAEKSRDSRTSYDIESFESSGAFDDFGGR